MMPPMAVCASGYPAQVPFAHHSPALVSPMPSPSTSSYWNSPAQAPLQQQVHRFQLFKLIVRLQSLRSVYELWRAATAHAGFTSDAAGRRSSRPTTARQFRLSDAVIAKRLRRQWLRVGHFLMSSRDTIVHVALFQTGGCVALV
jgi:hypothetical protein